MSFLFPFNMSWYLKVVTINQPKNLRTTWVITEFQVVNMWNFVFIKTYSINSVWTELSFNCQVRHFSWAVRWAVVSWEKGGRHSTQINAIQQNNTAQRRFLWQVVMRKELIMIFLWLYFEASSSTYIFQRPIKKQDKIRYSFISLNKMCNTKLISRGRCFKFLDSGSRGEVVKAIKAVNQGTKAPSTLILSNVYPK